MMICYIQFYHHNEANKKFRSRIEVMKFILYEKDPPKPPRSKKRNAEDIKPPAFKKKSLKNGSSVSFGMHDYDRYGQIRTRGLLLFFNILIIFYWSLNLIPAEIKEEKTCACWTWPRISIKPGANLILYAIVMATMDWWWCMWTSRPLPSLWMISLLISCVSASKLETANL